MLKYWARSSCHGANLPINDLTQPRPEYQRADRFKSEFTSYAIKVQKLVEAHKLQDIRLAEITFPKVHKIKSITPRFGLSGEISKKTTSHNQCKARAEAYIDKRYKYSLKIFTDSSKDATKALAGCAVAIPSLNYSQMFKLNEH